MSMLDGTRRELEGTAANCRGVQRTAGGRSALQGGAANFRGCNELRGGAIDLGAMHAWRKRYSHRCNSSHCSQQWFTQPICRLHQRTPLVSSASFWRKTALWILMFSLWHISPVTYRAPPRDPRKSTFAPYHTAP